MSALALKPTAHVIDVLGNVIGRDQPILRMEKALEMVSLLGEDVFRDENVVFFDPFCKAGELLLACAFLSCKAKLKTTLLDLDMVFKEIYESNRYYGLAPDERHHRLSTRTFLGNTYSHDEKFNHVIRDGHYLSEENGALDKDKFDKEFNYMIDYIKAKSGNKRIISIGNPPYQESDGGGIDGTSSKPIYNYFIEKMIDSKMVDEFLFVIPARWFSDGKGLDQFRNRILQCKQIKNIHYIEKSENVFPTVQIKGGVCFLNWSNKEIKETTFVSGDESYKINLNQFDMILDDPKGIDIVSKLKSKWTNKWVSDVAYSRNVFGLKSDYFKSNPESKKSSAIECYSVGRKIRKVERNQIEKNDDLVGMYKVAIPKAYGKGMKRCTMPVNQFFMINPNQISTETYSILGVFKTKQEAENYLSYLKTDFVRYLLGRKITQNVSRDSWAWVPYVDTKKSWTHASLCKYFGLSESEQNHISKKAQEWS